MKTTESAIEEILTAHPYLYLEHCAVMAVALMRQQAESPCEFIVECRGFSPPDLDGETKFLLRVSWTEHTALKALHAWHTEQSKSVVERAAVALAALLFAQLLPNGQMRATKHGDHADYWLPRLRCALEISGTVDHREFQRRHREKIAQMLGNPLQWNGYVVICCFAESQRIIRWSFHKQEE